MTKLEICNMSLVRIGERTITSLVEDSKAADLCNTQYAKSRNEVVINGRFTFAQAVTAPTIRPDAPPTSRWAAWFDLPADCIRVLFVRDENAVEVDHSLINHRLLSNNSYVEITYVSNALFGNDDSLIPDLVATAIAAHLAWRLSIALAQSPAVTDRLLRDYMDAMRDARHVNSTELTPEVLEADEWSGSRAGYGTDVGSRPALVGIPPGGVAGDYLNATLNFPFDGVGGTILTGLKGYVEVPFRCYVTGWSLLATSVGSMVVDIYKDSFGNYPPVSNDSICGGAKPTLTNHDHVRVDSIPTWSVDLEQGDILAFNVDSCVNISVATLVLNIRKR